MGNRDVVALAFAYLIGEILAEFIIPMAEIFYGIE